MAPLKDVPSKAGMPMLAELRERVQTVETKLDALRRHL